MFRTRDFLLVLTTIAFLVIAIGGTFAAKQPAAVSSTQSERQFAPALSEAPTVSLYTPESLSREERRAALREKIAASGTLEAPNEAMASAPEQTAEPATDTATDTPVTTASVQQCAGYYPYSGDWPASGIEFREAEGVRVVSQVASAATGVDSTAATGTEVAEHVLAQLPIRSLPITKPNCLSSDVVGIAQDGSLIRNNEAGLYSVFGAGTLIGYALDGFPIYGVADMDTDQCGGAIVDGQYRYYLADDREIVLSCFAGTPTAL